MAIDTSLAILRTKIANFGKENQGELLYALAEGAMQLSGSERVRIYLEDLTRGALSCVHATGPGADNISETGFPIVSTETIVSSVFASQYAADFKIENESHGSADAIFARRYGFSAGYIMPLVSQGKSIGVLCIDYEQPGMVLAAQAKSQLADFAGYLSDRLDQARIYHQQVQLARRLEESKAREVAGMMVRSAVRLIEKLSLASVLVPVHGGMMPTRARCPFWPAIRKTPNFKALYDQQGAIDLKKDNSLISNYVNDQAVITDERLLKPLFISDLTQHNLQKRALTESMALRSLVCRAAL